MKDLHDSWTWGGRATREVELIWWSALYKMSEHGQLIIRFYLEKCEF